jgi:hypothetical protein
MLFTSLFSSPLSLLFTSQVMNVPALSLRPLQKLQGLADTHPTLATADRISLIFIDIRTEPGNVSGNAKVPLNTLVWKRE